MRIETISPPEKTAILLEEVKDHLRIDGAEEGAALGALSATAVTLVETYLSMALVNRPVAIFLDGFSSPTVESDHWWSGIAEGAVSALETPAYHIELPVKPIGSIEKIEIKVANSDWVEWGNNNYYLKPGLMPALVRKYGRAWPVPGTPVEGVKVSAKAGFGADWNHVPASIRQALLMLIGHLYYNRGDTATGSPLQESGAADLLAAYRGMRL